VAVRVFRSSDDLTAAVGEHLGYSAWIEMPQARINQFAEATGDHQRIHVDSERASAGPFGSTIAHGFLVLSLIPSMLWDIFAIENASMQMNYGCDRVRFTSPVPVGSYLRASAQIDSVQHTPNGIKVLTRATIERQDREQPACIADLLALVVFES
jgi:acyl dehydratase